MIRRLRRWWAMVELDRVDAEVARWYVDDGQLSLEPLSGHLSPAGARLRELRLAAVAELERFGGRDPHPPFLAPPAEWRRHARLHRVL